MYAEERQRLIVDGARAEGRVEVSALASQMDVTPETIRRDLSRLERLGMIRRVHGGAVPIERAGFEPPLEDRRGLMLAEKERIAKRALEEIPPHGAVLLDAGTTTALLATHLPTDRELTVVTNALDIATQLARQPSMKVLVVGGRVRERTLAVVDSWTACVLSDLYVDVAFMATNGVSAQRGLTTPDPTEAATKRAMMDAARRVVVLADHTKVGNDHLVRFADLTDVDLIISDVGLDKELLVELEATGVEVVRA